MRVAADGLAYGLATTVAAALGISVLFVAKGRARPFAAAFGANWRTWALAGGCTAGAYAMVVGALRAAPVGGRRRSPDPDWPRVGFQNV